MSKIEVNTVAPQCGTTLTLGESGDTVQLGTGASQSGFGRTGTVDWQTGDIKTSTFTAVNGQGFFVDTNGGAVTANLPAGSAGAIVSFQDYRNTFDTASLTITPNGSEKINSGAGSVVLTTEGEGITLVYIDSTVGWRSIQDNVFADSGSNFIVATGGTITTSGNDKIHTFTGPGTFCVSTVAVCAANNVVSYAVVGGGGGGASGGGSEGGGAGGAGGFREVSSPSAPYTASPLDGYPSAPNRITVTATSFPITVGAGGAGGPGSSAPNECGSAGANSIFSTITSAGGGKGGGAGQGSVPTAKPGGSGGSGGGGGTYDAPGGAGNTPPTTPAQGTNGGTGGPGGPGYVGGGGGGATAVGTAGSTTAAGVGGAGATSSINATPTARAGGGGGGSHPSGSAGAGGAGGGGAGGDNTTGTNGTGNTGGGGGGSGGATANVGGTGGSGVVIIRYKFQ
jgi:hypothetical protein